MKRKEIEKIRDKSNKDLQKDVVTEKNEIAKLKLEHKVNPPKDSNIVKKKRMKIAVMLTVMNEKKLQETV